MLGNEMWKGIPVWDSDFFFVLRSCHVDQYTFHNLPKVLYQVSSHLGAGHIVSS